MEVGIPGRSGLDLVSDECRPQGEGGRLGLVHPVALMLLEDRLREGLTIIDLLEIVDRHGLGMKVNLRGVWIGAGLDGPAFCASLELDLLSRDDAGQDKQEREQKQETEFVRHLKSSSLSINGG